MGEHPQGDGTSGLQTAYAAPQPDQRTVLPVQFVGSGSEYFRIWVVNLLLMLVTLGLYYPWARVRRLKYFYNHTLVDRHALDFHGEPRRMLRGMLIVAVFMSVYSFAWQAAAIAGLVAALAVSVLWPLIWRAANKFRLSHTSWRGLRFGFGGDIRSAVIAVGVPVALLVVPMAAGHLLIMGDTDPQSPQGMALVQSELKLYGVVFLVWGLALPWFTWRTKRYLHGGFRYARLTTELNVGPEKVYEVFFKSLVVILCAVVVAALVGVAAGAVAAVASQSAGAGLGLPGARGRGFQTHVFIGIVCGMLAGYLIFFVALRAYFMTRLQNLFWSRTGNRWVRFKSALRLWPTLKLMFGNWLLVVLTLGLHWPFAAVATWRLRTEAITVHTRLPVDQMMDMLSRPQEDAAGDMAADLGDLDVAW